MRIERAAITAQHEASVECRYGARVSVAVKVLLVLQRETERFADVVVIGFFTQEFLSELKQHLAGLSLDNKRAAKLLAVT